MAKKRSTVASRAWRMLRLSLLWARKGGAFRRGMVFDFRIVRGSLKGLKPGGRRGDRLQYGERQFSFPKTPVFQLKTQSMRLPRIPCINPIDDSDNYDDNDNDYLYLKSGGEKYLTNSVSNDIYVVSASPYRDDDGDNGDNDFYSFDDAEPSERGVEREEEEIDLIAEKFITSFYSQMKLQRGLSSNQYNEMLRRSGMR